MLKKLFKYDFRSVGRIWWIIAVSVLGISLVSSLAMRMVTEQLLNDHPFLLIIVTLLFIFAIFAVFASVLVTEILVFWRFYKNFFTDEGYLTFTLPVSRKQLLLSKLLTSIVWNLINAALIVACALIMIALIPPASFYADLFKSLAQVVTEFFSSEGWISSVGWTILYVIEGILIVTALSVLFTALVFLCITLGSMIAKKLKLLVGIGIYYGFNLVFSSITQIVLVLFTSSMASGMWVIFSNASVAAQNSAIALILLIVLAFVSAVAALLYFITQNCLERKLNLP